MYMLPSEETRHQQDRSSSQFTKLCIKHLFFLLVRRLRMLMILYSN